MNVPAEQEPHALTSLVNTLQPGDVFPVLSAQKGMQYFGRKEFSLLICLGGER